jgi:hypothetical protein
MGPPGARYGHTVWDCKYHLVWVNEDIGLTDEVWAEYIKNQSWPEPDDDIRL